MRIGGVQIPDPTLNLNFAGTDNRGSASQIRNVQRITGQTTFPFSRNSGKTSVDRFGRVVTVGANEPTVDYRNGVNLGYSAFAGATNLLLRSEEFDGVYWTKARATVTANTTTAPDGTQTADTINASETNVNGFFVTRGAISVTTATTYTLSVHIKKGTGNFAVLQAFDGGANGVRRWFNVNDGTLGSLGFFGTGWTEAGSSIVSLGDGWYRCVLSFVTSGTNTQVVFYPSTPNDLLFSTNINDIGILWGAQLEVGPIATPYIKTVASTATRNADVLTFSGADTAKLIGQGEGVLLTQFRNVNTGTNRTLATVWENEGDFVGLSQTSRSWVGMTTLGNDVYCAVFNGDIYKQTGGTGDFIALSQTSRSWVGITTLGNDVYASVVNGDIYKQTNGTGDFMPLGQTSRNWRGMTTLGSDVYASVTNGDIYKQTGGTGNFEPLSQTSRNWRGMTTLGNDVYACVNGGDIYKQTGGTGDFNALGQTSRAWDGMTTLESDVYASVENGDIYKQTGGTGNFVGLGQTSRGWQGMTTLESDVYASVFAGDIYKQVAGDFVKLRLSTDNKLIANVRTAGSDQALIESATLDNDTDYNVALKYAKDDIKLFVNGAQVGSSVTTATIPKCSNINIGGDAGAFKLNGNVARTILYNVAQWATDAIAKILTR